MEEAMAALRPRPPRPPAPERLAPPAPAPEHDPRWMEVGSTLPERLGAALDLVRSLSDECLVHGTQTCAHYAGDALASLEAMLRCMGRDDAEIARDGTDQADRDDRADNPDADRRASALSMPARLGIARRTVQGLRREAGRLAWDGSADLARAALDDMDRLAVQLGDDIGDAESERYTLCG